MSAFTPFRCVHHGILVATPLGCPRCLEEWKARRDAERMTGAERAAEMERWGRQLTLPLRLLLTRFDELVGRPVYTHEIGVAWDGLLAEAGRDGPERGRVPTEEELLRPLRERGKAVLVVRPDEDEGPPDAR